MFRTGVQELPALEDKSDEAILGSAMFWCDVRPLT